MHIAFRGLLACKLLSTVSCIFPACKSSLSLRWPKTLCPWRDRFLQEFYSSKLELKISKFSCCWQPLQEQAVRRNYGTGIIVMHSSYWHCNGRYLLAIMCPPSKKLCPSYVKVGDTRWSFSGSLRAAFSKRLSLLRLWLTWTTFVILRLYRTSRMDLDSCTRH